MAKPVTLFAYPASFGSTRCGVELAFSVNFTFSLTPQYGSAGSNGFAFVIAAKGKLGKADGVGYGGMGMRSVAIEFDTLPNAKHNDMKQQHVGLNINGLDKSVIAVESSFTLTNGDAYTAWVDYDPWNRGTVRVFLANSNVKPEKPLLQSTLSLCEVLQPSVQQPAFFFGFVASTTVKPFQRHAILKSGMSAGKYFLNGVVLVVMALGLELAGGAFAPLQANPFFRYVSADYEWTTTNSDSWAVRACWAYAAVASVEAAYGIATNQIAPQLSVEPLFAAMGLTDTKCTAGGSPTRAFEKLVTLDASSGLMGGSNQATPYPVHAFERAYFKGHEGLMLAVQRQPVVVHIEALADTFISYDGVSHCSIDVLCCNLLGG
ncbi:unnamed protein product [Closterium sp. NIES-64]|nr:unnamed protein product [Closterium sp. NIES-64]